MNSDTKIDKKKMISTDESRDNRSTNRRETPSHWSNLITFIWETLICRYLKNFITNTLRISFIWEKIKDPETRMRTVSMILLLSMSIFNVFNILRLIFESNDEDTEMSKVQECHEQVESKNYLLKDAPVCEFKTGKYNLPFLPVFYPLDHDGFLNLSNASTNSTTRLIKYKTLSEMTTWHAALMSFAFSGFLRNPPPFRVVQGRMVYFMK